MAYPSKAMIVGIGVDVVEIERVREFAIRHCSRLGSVFTPTELAYCNSKAEFLGFRKRNAAALRQGISSTR
jgi:phosphopantetheinyl transferase (holo-ACP synthase)